MAESEVSQLETNLKDVISLQKKVAKLAPGNGRKIINQILPIDPPNSWKEFVNIAREIVYASKIRPACMSDIVDMCITISLKDGYYDKFPLALFTELLNQEAYYLLRLLTMEGLYSLNSIKDAITTHGYSDVVLYFADVLKIDDYVKNEYTISEKYREHLNLIRECLKQPMFDFAGFYDKCWLSNDVGIYLKNDDISIIRPMFESTTITLNKPIKWSPFEYYPKPEQTTLISVAALFGATKCFNYLVGKKAAITKSVIDSAIIGSSDSIYKLVSKDKKSLAKSFVTMHNYHRFDLYEDVKNGIPPTLTALIKFRNYESILHSTADGEAIDSKDGVGYNSVHHAAEAGAYDALIYLVISGADINNPTQLKWTALNLAAKSGNLTNAKFLYSKKAKHTEKNNLGWSILHSAAQSGSVKMLEWVLSLPAIRIDMLDASDYNVLLHAAISGSISLVEYLIHEKGLEINYKSRSGFDLLDVAVINNHIELIKHLLNNYFFDISNERREELRNLATVPEIKKLFAKV